MSKSVIRTLEQRFRTRASVFARIHTLETYVKAVNPVQSCKKLTGIQSALLMMNAAGLVISEMVNVSALKTSVEVSANDARMKPTLILTVRATTSKTQFHPSICKHSLSKEGRKFTLIVLKSSLFSPSSARRSICHFL